jgi:DNA-binding NarL/FixJ family response regulator
LFLLVDDDLLYLRATARAVGRHIAHLTATTIADAAAIVPKHRISGALVDEYLPDGRGLEFLATLRDKNSRLVGGLMTAGTIGPEITDRVSRLHVRVFAKPIGSAALDEFVSEVIAADAVPAGCRRAKLTQSETELVLAVEEGYSRATFATRNRITLATVRTYARSICKKTGFAHIQKFIDHLKEEGGRRD